MQMEDNVEDAPDDVPWSELFTWQRSAYYGYCTSVEQVDELVQMFSYCSSTSYIVTRATKNFGHFHLTGLSLFSTTIHSHVHCHCNLCTLA